MSSLGRVAVEPSVFTKVDYDADTIAALVHQVAARVPGLPDGLDVRIEVDEEEPTPRLTIASLDPLVFTIESGALEETKRPRTFGPTQASLALAQLFLQVRDRLDPAFGGPDLGASLDLATKAAWEASCVGRASRLGFDAHKPRFRYNFRNRFGFSDAADAEFDRIWSNDTPTWSDLTVTVAV